MAISQRVDFLIETFRAHGLFEMLRVGWSGLFSFGGTRRILVALSKPRPVLGAYEAAKGHTFRFATADDLVELQKDPANEIAEIDIERIKKGVRCLLQLDGDTLAGYAWVWGNQLPYIADGFHLNLPDDTIYNYKSYTAPQYRGYGFQAVRHVELLRLLEAEGVRRLFGFVDHFNSKSLKGTNKSGYEKVGELMIRHKNGRVEVKLKVEEHFWSETPRL